MKTFVLILITAALSGCQSAARNVMYSAWETVGVEKRDLLKSKIENVRDDQKEAGETFKDALDQLRQTYEVGSGELAQQYDKLRSAYNDSEKDANDVKTSIQKMETVAGDLFKEWEGEIEEIKTPELRAKSKERLRETKKRYQEMHSGLKATEARMEPILAKFKDQVLFMKHNLNAQAIGSLKNESIRIEKDINQLIERMNQSIKHADAFIAEMDR